MELQEEESNTGIVRNRDLSLCVSEEKYHSLLIKSGLYNQEPPSVVMEKVGCYKYAAVNLISIIIGSTCISLFFFSLLHRHLR